jgi:hypothetical protein
MKRSIITLLTLTATLFLSARMADASGFTIHWNSNIMGLDTNFIDINPNRSSDMEEVNFCQQTCNGNPRCMAFTWVRRGVQGPFGRCFFKASPRIVENNGVGPLTIDTNTVTGVKIYQFKACWARHLGNLKFCNTIFAGSAGGSSAPSTVLECPPGSRTASVSNRSIPGRFDRFCVARLASDPGGLPNCTDAFGGESHEDGVLGNQVNHACLDAE